MRGPGGPRRRRAGRVHIGDNGAHNNTVFGEIQ